MSRHKNCPENPASIDLSSSVGNLLEEDPVAKEVFRSTQSLGLITQRFMSLRQKNEVMNLNAVAKELSIPKRRVYDVINVLEGLGYVQKIEKNNIQWIGEAARSDEQDHLEATVEVLRQQEKILECMMRDAQAILQLHFEDPIARPYNYISKEDIRRTTDPNSKLIIMKSDNDTDNKFDVQIADSHASGCHDVIVRNISGVKSHALLFNNDSPVMMKEREETDREESEDEQELLEGPDADMSLTESPSKLAEVKLEAVDIDPDDLETFVLPSSSTANLPYVPETPGRGLYFSPFKSMIDPCILPTLSDDLINITAPSAAAGSMLQHEEPFSIMDIFSDF